MGGGGGSQTVGYRYYLGMHMVVSMQMDKVVAIKVDDKVAWEGNVANGTILINKPDLFGGDSGEGGVSGFVDVMSGSASQPVNSYLEAQLVDQVPAFRGVVSFVLNRCYLGNNPYLKTWSFTCTRIHTRQDGQVQWYNAKAEIPSFANVTILSDSISLTSTFSPRTNTDPDVNYIHPNTLNIGTYHAANLQIIAGNIDQATNKCRFDTVMTVNGDGYHRDQIIYPVYPDYAEWGTILFSGTIDGPVVIGVWDKVQEPDGSFSLGGGGVGAEGDIYVRKVEGSSDMNPAHILRECLTDQDWGMGYNEADMDDDSFMAAADKLYSEGMGISMLWDSQTEMQDFITTILRHIDAAIYVDRRTGLFKLKLIRNDYDVDDLLELTEDDIDRVDDFKRAQFGELTTSVTVKYSDSATNGDGGVTIQDIALEAMQDANINSTLNYPGFTNSIISTKVAQRDLRALSSQIASCTVYTDRTAKDLQVGDVFLMTWPDYEFNRTPMRVTGVAYGDGKSNRIRLTCSEDVFNLDEHTFVATPPTVPTWVDPNGPPTAATLRRLYEVPYLEMVKQLTQTSADAQLATNPDTGYVGVAVGRPTSSAISCPIHSDSGSGYTEVAVAQFCPVARLFATIDRMQLTFPITQSDEIDLVSLGSWVQLDNELMRVDAISTTSITVARGCLDTIPSIHTSGAILYFWEGTSSADPTQYVAGETILVKLTPKTGSGTFDLASAPADSITLNDRAIRPYPPGNLKINSSYFPAQIEGDMVLTWAHRDRTQQTGGTLLSFTDGSVGPETGTSYILKVYNGSNSLVRTVTGISGATTTYTTAQETTDGGPFSSFRFTLESKRGIYNSYQLYDISLTRPAPIPALGVFIPSNSPPEANPHIVGWNNGYFVVCIEGTVEGHGTVGLYRIKDDLSKNPEYIGTLYQDRLLGATHVYRPYNGSGLEMNTRYGYPIMAGGIDDKLAIFYSRRDSSLNVDYRWLIAYNDTTTDMLMIKTSSAIDTDIVFMLELADASAMLAWAVDAPSGAGSPLRLWKSTNGGKVWSYLGPCTGVTAEPGIFINPSKKVFQIGSTIVLTGVNAGTLHTAASDGLTWVAGADIDTGFGAAAFYDFDYDGTALVCVGQRVAQTTYDAVVLADNPLTFIDYLGGGPVFGDKVPVPGSFRQLRIVPNGVGISGWGIGVGKASTLSPNALEPGAVIVDTGALGAASIDTVTGSFLEVRNASNGAINFIQGASAFSIEAWLHPVYNGLGHPPGNTLTHVLFSQNIGGSPQFQNILLTYNQNTKLLRFRTIRQTASNTYVADQDIQITTAFNIMNPASLTATHLVITRAASGGKIRVYINGTDVGGITSGTATNFASSGGLGCVWGNTNSQLNAIDGGGTTSYELNWDALCIYDTELTSTQVSDHYDTAQAEGLTHNCIWKSTNAGTSWTKVRDVQMDLDLNVSGVGFYLKYDKITAFNGGFAVYGQEPFSGSFPYVVLSTDHGATWATSQAVVTSDVTNGANLVQLRSINNMVFATAKTRTVVASLYPQFVYSTDGITFTDMNPASFPTGSSGINLIVLDDTDEPRISETGEPRITEG